MSEYDVRVLETQIAELEDNYRDACARLSAIYELLPSGSTDSEVLEEVYNGMFDPIGTVVKIIQILEEGA